MEIVRGIHNVRARHRGAAVTIGNFDGVHRGHQAMIAQLRQAAAERGCAAYVVTFEPHPTEYLTPHRAPARLTTLREKVRRLAATGVDGVVALRFDHSLAGLGAEDFALELLGRRLGVQYVLVGDDFRFGAARGGDLALLSRLGARAGFIVHAMETVCVAAERVSSTRVRAAVAVGRFAEAAELLGQPFQVSGRVVHGDAMGRQLGWPTANLRVPAARLPLRGIYAARAYEERPKRGRAAASSQVLDGWPAAVSVGVRPTIDGRQAVFEAHLIDFSGDLYGRHLRIEPVQWLRGERQFPGLEALAQQIGRDVETARRLLQGDLDPSEAVT
ncbi:riboflavin biosynthesis protein RibF [Halorhodospira abdelmalekii]|uniref:bifunctional riboflavin kinase/FAD synthetase n=1 Tax=Halorhodospira abdelmalekii TaxID=421629 RepID=UPI0019050099|nr:bifunctional riboflavin kinase/FAD synthetase [Halorhodospira abdelmalekii]MBK1735183.1 riboflavin biosynthesis protein RibF [Halorhodospira abdelmalekii]